MERQWIKHLAQSWFDGEKWILREPNGGISLGSAQLEDFIDSLFQKLSERLSIYNSYALAPTQIKLYKLKRDAQSRAHGLVMMLGNLQLQIEQDKTHLFCDVAVIARAGASKRRFREFVAQCDDFGLLSWRSENGQNYELTSISRQFLVDCLRLAHQAGIISSVKNQAVILDSQP